MAHPPPRPCRRPATPVGPGWQGTHTPPLRRFLHPRIPAAPLSHGHWAADRDALRCAAMASRPRPPSSVRDPPPPIRPPVAAARSRVPARTVLSPAHSGAYRRWGMCPACLPCSRAPHPFCLRRCRPPRCPPISRLYWAGTGRAAVGPRPPPLYTARHGAAPSSGRAAPSPPVARPPSLYVAVLARGPHPPPARSCPPPPHPPTLEARGQIISESPAAAACMLLASWRLTPPHGAASCTQPLPGPLAQRRRVACRLLWGAPESGRPNGERAPDPSPGRLSDHPTPRAALSPRAASRSPRSVQTPSFAPWWASACTLPRTHTTSLHAGRCSRTRRGGHPIP